MNSLPLSTLFNSDIFSDITIDLVDEDCMTTLNLHKNILYLSCPYFRSMFNGFKETNSSKITLQVPNVQVTCDIIRSFYGIENNNKKNWKYILNIYLCENYFCINTKLPQYIKVSPDEFEDFLSMTEKIGFNKGIDDLIINNIPKSYDIDKLLHLEKRLNCDNNKYIELIATHIPDTYDFSELPKNIVKKLWQIVDTYHILTNSKNDINIINSEGKNYLFISLLPKIKKVYYLENRHGIAFYTKLNIYIYDIKLKEYILTNPLDYKNVAGIHFYNELFIINNNDNKINIYNINDGSLVNTLEFKKFDHVINIFVDEPNNKLIIFVGKYSTFKKIYIYELDTLKYLTEYCFHDTYLTSYFDSIYQESIIAWYEDFCTSGKLFILNFQNNTNICIDYMVYNYTSNIIGICWTEYNIVCCYENGTINIYDILNKKLIKTININKTINAMTKITDDIIMVKCGCRLIKVNLVSGEELDDININPDVISMTKISSGHNRLHELLPKIENLDQ
ncbi:putative BTB/POZ domain-containing protein [Powai lake megavirus]|uniref:Putative BTB/POZ domain-containing protein n=1 Tax=Powai lake megavirus TaxID=1842663 RepID=A0A160ERA9_9VIRU|nr:putative BTB/POZ domain-containing protein [Powai lake megavirus]ANB51088.1 putative BTB/POZ domain-containing protein [Powai lake megavirus]